MRFVATLRLLSAVALFLATLCVPQALAATFNVSDTAGLRAALLTAATTGSGTPDLCNTGAGEVFGIHDYINPLNLGTLFPVGGPAVATGDLGAAILFSADSQVFPGGLRMVLLDEASGGIKEAVISRCPHNFDAVDGNEFCRGTNIDFQYTFNVRFGPQVLRAECAVPDGGTYFLNFRDANVPRGVVGPKFVNYGGSSTNTYTVTGVAMPSAAGSVSCTSPVGSGSTATCLVTTNPGYTLTGASSNTCAGSLSGNTYTTSEVTSACTVTATFSGTATSFTVTGVASPSAGGAANCSSPVSSGSTTACSITANSGYTLTGASSNTCGGSLSGNTYTTGPVTSACTVTASFSQQTTSGPWTVSTTTTGNGTLACPSPIANNGSATCAAIPGQGSQISNFIGTTCPGNAGGFGFAAGPITANCTVQANFTSASTPTYNVTGAASPSVGGGVSCANPVISGSATTCSITTNSGYALTGVSGCDGIWSGGNSFTTGLVTSACTVTASFSPVPVNGVCGVANGMPSAIAPSSGLCSSGIASAVTNTNPTQWTWTCGGSSGGTNAACSAPRTTAPTCTLTALPPTITAGQSATLTATCSPPATSYAWTNTGFGPTVSTGNVLPTVTTTYSVIGSNAAGSGNSAIATVIVTPCTYSLSPASQSVTAGATTGTLDVTTTTGCLWTAASNVAWITITPGSGGSGSGAVTYAVAANPSSNSRTGTLTVGGQTFSVTQAGGLAVPTCTLTASASTINLGSSVILTATCSPAATDYTWTPASGLVPGLANTANVTPSAAGIYQYSVTGSNASGAGNIASASVTVTVPVFTSQSNCLFNWAEITYPSLFAPSGAISNSLATYYYRHYQQTNAYLATSSADSHVYYLGPLSNNSILDVGALSVWLSTAGCQ